MSNSGARWSPGDGTISWAAKRLTGGVLGPSQIYTASVVFDGAGNVIGLASQPAAPALALEGASAHDWSPDGARMVINVAPYTGTASLWIAELGSGVATLLPTTSPASAPVWSPDGSRIAFTTGWNGVSTLSTIAPDGSNERVLATLKPNDDLSTSFRFPEWSPHGTHLVYQKSGAIVQGRQDVWRVGATGQGATNLTAELDTRSQVGTPASPLGWR